jgi:hypothetical protein
MTRLVFLLLLTAWAGFSNAQSALRSPADFLPHPYGRQFTPHHLMVEYVQYMARESNRVEVISYGQTYEGRPLLLAFISSPANLARLENIRQNNLKAAGFLPGEPEGKPLAIVWLSFGIHGNETGAAESAMNVLHSLASNNPYLDDALIILDPCINPDGYNRYTNWYRQVAPIHADPLPFAREHREPWPGGRPNHYLFDLNRDWAWGAQAETRQRLVQYQRWMPHVHADFHEQFPNSNAYFAPAAEPFHPSVTHWQRDFQTDIGQNIANSFDREGWLYFTREWFDLFYPGYGDSYPTLAGAIGMTFEQAGHSVAGRAIELDNGDILTLQDRIDRHTASALATVETAAQNAPTLAAQFKAFYDRAKNRPPGPHQAFVIRHTNPADQLRAFTRFLDMHQIRYGKAGRKSAAQAYDYRSGLEMQASIHPEDLVISAFQPAGTLAQALLEPAPLLPDSLTYDITAWSLLYAYGFDALALENRLEPEAPWAPAPYPAPNWPNTAPYAYIASWTSLDDARFLAELLQEGFVVRQSLNPFRLQDAGYPQGTLLIIRSDNRHRADFQERIQQLAEARQRPLGIASTGRVDSGGDFGSASMRIVHAPRIALISGEPVRPQAFGAAWHFFEEVLGYPVSILDAASFQPARLKDFDTLILPGGDYSWDEGVRKKLAEWVREGGRVIAIGPALRWLQGMDGVSLVSKDIPTAPESKKEIEPKRYEDREREGLASQISGALFETQADSSHPLCFGLPMPYFSLKTSAQTWGYLEKGWNAVYLSNSPRYFGFAGAKALEKNNKSLVAGAESIGRGAAVYLVDDPLFRGFWSSGQLLFANAVFFGI